MTASFRFDQSRVGEYYNGVPARDLTAEEVAALPAEQQEWVRSGDLYAPADSVEPEQTGTEPVEPPVVDVTPPAPPAKAGKGDKE